MLAALLSQFLPWLLAAAGGVAAYLGITMRARRDGAAAERLKSLDASAKERAANDHLIEEARRARAAAESDAATRGLSVDKYRRD